MDASKELERRQWRPSPLATTALVAVLACELLGCGGGDRSSVAAPEAATGTYVRGKVFLDGPVAGADLRIETLDGTVLYARDTAIDERGLYDVRVPGVLPADFRVVASASAATGPFTLVAEVRDYDPRFDVTHLNAVTTLVAAHLRSHPQATFAEAREAVRRFLDVPRGANLRYGLDNSRYRFFDHAIFMAQARAHGGVDAFVGELTDTLASSPEARHPFRSPAVAVRRTATHVVSEDAEAGLADAVADEVASGAANYVGGKAAGWVLSLLGGGNGDGQALAEIERQITQVQQQLSDLSVQIGDLSQQVTADTEEILDAVDQSSYETAARVLDPTISSLVGLHERLLVLAQARLPLSADQQGDANQLASDIKSIVPTALSTIATNLSGQVGFEGLIHQWDRITFPARFVSSSNFGAYEQSVSDQYQYYLGAQVTALVLIVEAFHAETPSDTASAQSWVTTYQTNVASQNPVLPASIPAGAVPFLQAASLPTGVTIDLASGLMWGWGATWGRYRTDSDGACDYDFNGWMWADANTYCNDLSFAGYDDWRLPSLDEMTALFANGWQALTTTYDAPDAMLNQSGFETGFELPLPYWTSTPNGKDYWIVCRNIFYGNGQYYVPFTFSKSPTQSDWGDCPLYYSTPGLPQCARQNVCGDAKSFSKPVPVFVSTLPVRSAF